MPKSTSVIDPIFQALADPVRRGLVERLAEGPESVSRLAEPLPMSLPGVMQHLAVLAASGLVSSQKEGRVRTYSLNPEGLQRLDAWAAQQQRVWEQDQDRIGSFLNAIRPAMRHRG